MQEHDDEKQAAELFSKAVEAILPYRRTLEQHSDSPIKEWAGGEELSPGVSHIRYPIYREEVDEFFTELGEFLNFWKPVATDYQETASRFLDDHGAIGRAGPDEVKALLTWVFRGEKFCDGFWGAQLQSGLVTALLYRLYELYHSGFRVSLCERGRVVTEAVAQCGEDRFLVQVDEGIGRVVELDTGIVFPPFNIDSIIARGYWEEVTNKAGAERAVELVKQQSE